ncbi:MAG: DUF2283 domain-containing protein [Candidatus Latescibacterota bacterium]
MTPWQIRTWYRQGTGAAALAEEGDTVETLRIFARKERLDWDYDAEGDVLYLSLGQPQAAVGVDVGEGVVVRYDHHCNEVVGPTIVGLRQKLQRELDAHPR